MTRKRDYYTKEQHIDAKRKSMSYEGEQELTCIALLIHQGYEFVVLKPRKIRSKENRQIESFFFLINQIKCGETVIDLHQIITSELRMNDGCDENETIVSKKKRMKYVKRNIVSITNNLLSELLMKSGFTVLFKKTRQTEYVLKMNRIKSISGNGFGELTVERISAIGKKMNERLLQLFEENNSKRDDPLLIGKDVIKNIFNDSIHSEHHHDEEEMEKFRSEGFDIIQSDFGWYAVDKHLF